MVDIIISNTSPLLYLHRIQSLDWLPTLGERVWIPRAVQDELSEGMRGYVPLSVIRGSLAESWELPDPNTYIFQLRKGVHWHDKAPMNGRGLTAEDVVFNWHRMMGMGEFAEAGGSPNQGQITAIPFESITATDRYTVVFKTTEAQQDTLRNLVIHHAAWVYPPEVIREHGNIQDWRHAVGTRPYMLTDVVEGVSMTFTRNHFGAHRADPDWRARIAARQQAASPRATRTRLLAARTAQLLLESLSQEYLE